MKKLKLSNSPPRKRAIDEDEYDENSGKRIISPSGKLKYKKCNTTKSLESINLEGEGCEKSYVNKEQVIRASRLITQFIENINDKINMGYHKVTQNKELDLSFPIEYYHTLCYSGLDSLSLGCDILASFRSIMKNLRLFYDKYDCIIKKHEEFEKNASNYVNAAISNKLEKCSIKIDDNVKDSTIQNIFANFNNARDSFESIMKEIKSGNMVYMINSSLQRIQRKMSIMMVI
jgi:hypothetical protein